MNKIIQLIGNLLTSQKTRIFLKFWMKRISANFITENLSESSIIVLMNLIVSVVYCYTFPLIAICIAEKSLPSGFVGLHKPTPTAKIFLFSFLLTSIYSGFATYVSYFPRSKYNLQLQRKKSEILRKNPHKLKFNKLLVENTINT